MATVLDDGASTAHDELTSTVLELQNGIHPHLSCCNLCGTESVALGIGLPLHSHSDDDDDDDDDDDVAAAMMIIIILNCFVFVFK